MLIFELMAYYIPHRNWRARLAMNSATSNIWTFWVLSMVNLLAAFVILIREGVCLNFLVLVCVGAALFAVSFLFLPEAKRLHEIQRIVNNEILFGETKNEV